MTTFQDQLDEEWRDVVGWEGYYKVSNMGGFMSVEHTVTNKGKKTPYTIKGRIIIPSPDKGGYLKFGLARNGKHSMRNIHRLVAEAFIPNPDNLPQVNHINGIKADNRVENLEWCTPAQNSQHAYKIGLSKSRKKLEEQV